MGLTGTAQALTPAVLQHRPTEPRTPTAEGDPLPPNHHHDNDELDDHDLGLSHDLPTLLNRRRALGLLSGAGLAAALAACSSDGSSTATTSSIQVYATDGYDASLGNLAQTSLQTDMVFSDGLSLQLGRVTGDVGTGMTVALNVPV